jgi:hypothetical protein
LVRGVRTGGEEGIVEFNQRELESWGYYTVLHPGQEQHICHQGQGNECQAICMPLKGKTLGDTCDTIKRRSMVVNNEYVTGFPVDSSVDVLLFGVFRGLTGESKVNTRGIKAARLLAELSSIAGRAKIKDGVLVRKVWYPINMLMYVVHIFITGMAKMLVP